MKSIWKPLRLAVLSASALLLVSVALADTDPAKEVQEISQWRAGQIKEAQDAKKPLDYRTLMTQTAAKAKVALQGVDAAKVDPTKGLEWAQLFQLAQQPAGVISAVDRYLSTNPAAAQKYSAQMMEVTAYAQQEDGAGAYRVLNAMTPPDKMAAAQLAATVGNYAEMIAPRVGGQATLDLIAKVDKQTPWDTLTSDREKTLADYGNVSLASARSEIYKTMGKTAEALAALKAGKDKLSPNSRYARQLDMDIASAKLIGSPAPAIARERGYGEFPGLEACKGKVVLVDFMAHWCPPCKASLPSLKKLYNDFHSRGLEIVSVTTYYGYFGTERNLTPDAEFARMDGFVKEEGMTWPVAFGPRGNMESYGVRGIPTFALIDKSGKVHSVVVGYSPELFNGLRKNVESLLGVKVALK